MLAWLARVYRIPRAVDGTHAMDSGLHGPWCQCGQPGLSCGMHQSSQVGGGMAHDLAAASASVAVSVYISTILDWMVIPLDWGVVCLFVCLLRRKKVIMSTPEFQVTSECPISGRYLFDPNIMHGKRLWHGSSTTVSCLQQGNHNPAPDHQNISPGNGSAVPGGLFHCMRSQVHSSSVSV